MEYQKFIPEGWKVTNENLDLNKLKVSMQTGEVLQGLVYKCDEAYNLHVNLGNDLKGIIPRDEFELNREIKESILKNKENEFVQFKVKSLENSHIILSRKDVKIEALEWAKNDLKEGNIVCGIIRNIRPFGAFVEIGGGVVRTFTY